MSNEANRVKLLGISDPFRGKEYYINSDEFTVGRSNECDLLLAENTISATHAKIVKNGDKFEIYDLNSTNGTYVNAERVSRKELRADDILKFDVFEFRYLNAGDIARTVMAGAPDFEKAEAKASDTKESPIVQAATIKKSKPKPAAKVKFEKTGNLPMGLILGVLFALIIYIGFAFGSMVISTGMSSNILQFIEGSFQSIPIVHTHFLWLAPGLPWNVGTILMLAGVILASLAGGWLTKAISKKNTFVSALFFAITYVVVTFAAQIIVSKFNFTILTRMYSTYNPFGFYDPLLATLVIIGYFMGVSFILAFIGGLLKKN